MTGYTFASFALLLLGSSDAFTIRVASDHRSMTLLKASQQPTDAEALSRRSFAQSIGAAAFASLVIPNPAGALDPSSSLYVSDVMRTLDMSLPSYDAISSSKASVETVEGLAEVVVPEKEAPKKREPKKKREPSESGNPLGNLLPSMNKGNKEKAAPKPKEARVPKPKPAPKEKVEKVEKEPVVETMDMSLPSYSDSSTPSKRSAFAL